MLFKKLYAVIGCISLIMLIWLYFNYNPAAYSFFPQCPFYKLTGLNCPGCGSQRAIAALLHGNLAKAADYNLLLVLSLPLLFIHAGYKTAAYFLKQDYKWAVVYHPVTPKIILIVVVCFWILRNIPLYPFNYLAA